MNDTNNGPPAKKCRFDEDVCFSEDVCISEKEPPVGDTSSTIQDGSTAEPVVAPGEVPNDTYKPNVVNSEELDRLREFLVLDEVKSNDGESDNNSESSEDLPDDEIEKMLDEDLPEGFKGAPKPKEKTYVTKQKIVLEEKGVNRFEVLPLDWMLVRHYSGMPVYFHKTTRVCTLSRPYFLGKSSARRHDVPLSAIPCLNYRRALEEEEKQKEIDRDIAEQIASGSWKASESIAKNSTTESHQNKSVNDSDTNVSSNTSIRVLMNIDNDIENTALSNVNNSSKEINKINSENPVAAAIDSKNTKNLLVNNVAENTNEENSVDDKSKLILEYSIQNLTSNMDLNQIELTSNNDQIIKKTENEEKNVPNGDIGNINTVEIKANHNKQNSHKKKRRKSSKHNEKSQKEPADKSQKDDTDKPKRDNSRKSQKDSVKCDKVNSDKSNKCPYKSHDKPKKSHKKSKKHETSEQTTNNSNKNNNLQESNDIIPLLEPKIEINMDNLEVNTVETSNENRMNDNLPDKTSDNSKVVNATPTVNEIENITNNKEPAVDLSRQPVVLPGGIVMPPPRVETINNDWKSKHLTYEELNEYCKSLFKFKTINIMHFDCWSDRRKYAKARKTMQYPVLPSGTKLITIPASADIPGNSNNKAAKRDWVMNMNGCSYLSVFHEYVWRALHKQPTYHFQQLENASNPYQATVYIGGMQYGVGRGSSKRQAKAAAAKDSIHILIPEMKDSAPPSSTEADLSFFECVGIEDPRVSQFCAATCEPSPHAILRTCLLRNFGASDRHIDTQVTKLEYQKIELTMKVGKHSATVICKNKKTAKQRASQAILQALHPHVRSWGSLLRLYGARSVKTCKEKKLEEQQITLLQDHATQNQPNFSVLNKLRQEMLRLRERDEAVVPIGTLLLTNTSLPTHSGANLNNVSL